LLFIGQYYLGANQTVTAEESMVKF